MDPLKYVHTIKETKWEWLKKYIEAGNIQYDKNDEKEKL